MAKPALTANSSTWALSTGRLPGSPKTTGSTWVLGASPKAVELGEKILLRVASCTWVSRPMTATQSWCFCPSATAMASHSKTLQDLNGSLPPSPQFKPANATTTIKPTLKAAAAVRAGRAPYRGLDVRHWEEEGLGRPDGKVRLISGFVVARKHRLPCPFNDKPGFAPCRSRLLGEAP